MKYEVVVTMPGHFGFSILRRTGPFLIFRWGQLRGVPSLLIRSIKNQRSKIKNSIAVLSFLPLASAGADPSGVETLLQTGTTELSSRNFEAAKELFGSVIKETAPGSEPWAHAVFGAAVCAHHRSPTTQKRVEDAARLYHLLLESVAGSKFAPRAALNLGRLAELRDYYEDPVDLEAARNWYRRVIDRWPDLPIAGEATLRLAATFVQTYDMPEVRHGVDLLETWLTTRDDEPLAAGMWQYLGDIYFYPLADHAASLSCYRKGEALGFLDPNNIGTLFWRMAILAERFLEDRELAVEYYGKVIRTGAASGKGYQAQQALERLGAPVPELQLFQPIALTRPPE